MVMLLSEDVYRRKKAGQVFRTSDVGGDLFIDGQLDRRPVQHILIEG